MPKCPEDPEEPDIPEGKKDCENINPFEDYCSWSFDMSIEVQRCCCLHDNCYDTLHKHQPRLREEGTFDYYRESCDVQFRLCFEKAAGPVFAWVYYRGVRTFGEVPFHDWYEFWEWF